MTTRGQRKQHHTWLVEPLTPLEEGPGPRPLHEGTHQKGKEHSWTLFLRDLFKPSSSPLIPHTLSRRSHESRLLLSVLGCPLAPVPLSPIYSPTEGASAAGYILQQYLGATGWAKSKSVKNMYAAGTVEMSCQVVTGKITKSFRGMSMRKKEEGGFVIWQMSPSVWSLELVVGENKVVAGSNGRTVWRHTPWVGIHIAKGPQRPLRRIIQGLDPGTTAAVFGGACCSGEKGVGGEECFVLKVVAEGAAVMGRSEGHAEVIRHELRGCFSQKSGLLRSVEDSHLIRAHAPGTDTVYWETTMQTVISDYREVDGIAVAHHGCTMASIFHFGGDLDRRTTTRMQETWTIDDVGFNVPGLSLDQFTPPSDIFDNTNLDSF